MIFIPALDAGFKATVSFIVSMTCRAFELQSCGRQNSCCRHNNSLVTLSTGLPDPYRRKNRLPVVFFVAWRNLCTQQLHAIAEHTVLQIDIVNKINLYKYNEKTESGFY